MKPKNKRRKLARRAALRLLAAHPDACPFCHGKGKVQAKGAFRNLNCVHCDGTGSRAKAMELLLSGALDKVTTEDYDYTAPHPLSGHRNNFSNERC